MKRRKFLADSALLSSAMFLPVSQIDASKSSTLRFGVIADLHQDVMHDGPKRMEAFIEDMEERKPDFIIQLGDFCRPYNYNKVIMDLWKRFQGPRYHVIGNHDMDGGFTRKQVVDFWEVEGKYYSFDLNGYHLVILDGNDQDPRPERPEGYARYIGKEQLEWLETDLDQTDLPVIVFCHQGLDNDLGGIYNGTESRLVLERANKKAGFQKVILVFSGHHHQDYYNVINDIHYIQINSMSYQWLGDEYQHVRYSKEVDESHPWIKYTVPYRDPIWAYVEIDLDGILHLSGKKSEFVGKSPEAMGISADIFGYPIVPEISDKEINLKL